MPFSFNPGQEQTSAPAVVTTQSNNGVPALNVPVAPVITLTPVAEVISPFAYKNRGKSQFSVYFQGVIFLIFILMAIASVALFSFQSTIKLQISSRKDDLEKAQVGFKKPPALDDMQRLSSRLALINKIINERVSVNTAFKIVEDSIDSPVVYTKFSLGKSKKDTNYDLSFAGETNSYSSLYQQIEILNSKPFKGVFPKLSISGIGPLDKKGIAGFKVDASVAISGIDPVGFTVINGGTTTDQGSLKAIEQVSSSSAKVTQ